ncbi:TonB-dependent receptor [Colwellia sp. MB3u-70]|uniref:TonB-dependent receptor domain-containing protein n=1 Tax=unclassified Colwellia TaxID=196834 RepID=UPI0015F4E002|nr:MULTISPECIES: TonB-dependent receptor [unclassified Colwellia]MBA6292068.1 TonB-dependent receptor [Colwellia sp. MB3u-8]MBA6309051.1 TonB-dependent receptor [Colwellia sp. MB3u-70]
MYNNSKVAKAVRIAMMFGAGAAAAISAPAFSAEADEAEVEKVERIQVTGSRIKRTDLENASPVSVITTEDMKIQGITNVADALQNLTAQSGGLTAAVNNGGNGNATVNLRGLGSNRTLVLINGRRAVASGTGASARVDLNTIPMSAVKRIEVLKDGASAIYGSDAIAGVVNIIMRNDFEGIEFDATYSETSEGDGEESALSTTIGLSSDKGNIVVNLGYYDRGSVRQAARGYSECPIWETDDGDGPYKYCGGSSFSLGMNMYDGRDFSRYQFEPGGNGTSTPEGMHPWVNAGDNNDRYNYSALSYLSTPATRYNISVLGNYEISDNVSFFSEAYYTNRSSVQQMAPQPVYYGYGANGKDWMPSQNPEVYPFMGLYPTLATPGEDVLSYPLRRMQEVGPRIFEQEVNTLQLTTGLEGMIGDYSWDVFYTYGRNTAIDKSKNYINMDKMNRSVEQNCEGVTVTGTHDNYSVQGNDAANPCINYMGLGAVSATDADYIRYTDQGTSGTEMHHLGAAVSGDLFTLPAGIVGFAVGVEHREESAFNQPDAFTAAGIGAGNAVQPTAGEYSVDEMYFEMIVPLLSGVPFAEQVDLEVAMRAFDYDTFGSDDTYKLGLTWRMNDMVMLRSVLSTAFRAPSVGELFGGQSDSYTNYNDPCKGVGGADASSAYAGACAKDVSAGLIPGDGSWDQGNGQLRAVTGGNPELGPETADTFTVGLVVEPVEGLSFTIDYYNIEIDNVVSSIGVGTRLDKCYSAGAEGGVGGSNSFCNGVVRNNVGDFDGTPATSDNLSTWVVNGIDYNVQYKFEAYNLDWKLSLDASQIDEWSTVAFEGEDPIDTVGAASSGSGSIPKLKVNFGAQVLGDNWSISYNVMWVDKLETSSLFYADAADRADVAAGNSDNYADAFASHNISGSYHMNDNVTIRFGIDNFTDEEPPYYTDYDDSNTDTTLYHYVGTNYYLGTTINF